MTEQNSKFENVVFPFPKMVQTFNFFFPKEKDSPDFFTMENLRKFSRYAPYLGLGILAIIFSTCVMDGYISATSASPPPQTPFYLILDPLFVIIALIQYLWWMGASLLAKLVKRSPAVPLVLSFFSPLRTLGIFGVIHFFGFIFGCLYRLGNP